MIRLGPRVWLGKSTNEVGRRLGRTPSGLRSITAGVSGVLKSRIRGINGEKTLSLLKRITGGRVMHVLYSMLPRVPRWLRSTTRWSSSLLDICPWAWHRPFVWCVRCQQGQIHGGIRGIMIYFAPKGKAYMPLCTGYAQQSRSPAAGTPCPPPSPTSCGKLLAGLAYPHPYAVITCSAYSNQGLSNHCLSFSRAPRSCL